MECENSQLDLGGVLIIWSLVCSRIEERKWRTSTFPAPISLAAKEIQLAENTQRKRMIRRSESETRNRIGIGQARNKKSKSTKSSSFEKHKEKSLPPHLLVPIVEVATVPTPVPSRPGLI